MEWSRSLLFIGTDFETLQWDRPEDERLLRMTGYGDEWSSWQVPPFRSDPKHPIHSFSVAIDVLSTRKMSLFRANFGMV